MEPGQRVNLINQIAKALFEKERVETDLILGQFGFPTGGFFNYEYCIDMIKDGEDSKLVALYEHLCPNDSLPQLLNLEKEGYWQENTFRLFMSHSSKNKQIVSEVKQELVRYGIDCFVAHDAIEPTKKWLDEIEKALKTCHSVAAFLNNDFKSSDFCDQEIGYGLQRGVLIIPVEMGAYPYGFMHRYQAIKAGEMNSHSIAGEIYKTLAAHSLSREPIYNVHPFMRQIVNSFLKSNSFASADSKFTEVERLNFILPELLKKIEDEWEKNNQIKNSYGVPERIKKLLTDRRRNILLRLILKT